MLDARSPLAAWILIAGSFGFLAGCQAQDAQEEHDATTKEALDDGSPQGSLKSPPTSHWTNADDAIIAPIWTGDENKGQLYTPLWRGALPGIEEVVFTPDDGDCTKGKVTIRVDWDSTANTVHFMIKGHGMVPNPTVIRQEGTEWQFNPFHPVPKDIVNGAYRLWIVEASVTRTENLWYDGSSLQLTATEFTAATQPPNSIQITLPAFSIQGTHQFNPDSHGNVVHEFTAPYDVFPTEGGAVSRDWVTFAPLDLCESMPLQPAISQLRPVASPWLPPSQSPSWRELLRSGLAFDLHAEQKADPTVLDGNLPYVYSGVSAFSQHPGLQGGVPNGSHMELSAAILNVAPPIDPVPGGNGHGCQRYINEARFSAPRYCEGQQ